MLIFTYTQDTFPIILPGLVWHSMMLVFVALCALLHQCAAFKIVGAPSYQNYITNGAISSNRTITVQCSPADLDQTFTLQVTPTSGATIPVTVTCKAPVAQFNVAIQGYLPTDGIRQCYRACAVRGISVVTPGSNTNFTDRSAFYSTNPGFVNAVTAENSNGDSNIPVISHIQRLMKERKRQDLLDQEELDELQANHGRNRHLLQLDPGSFALATVAYAVAFTALVQVNLLSSKVSSLQTEADTTKQTLSNYINATDVWEGQTTQQLQTLDNVQHTTYAIETQALAAQTATSNALNASIQSNIALASALNSNFTSVYRNLTSISNQMLTLSAIVNATVIANTGNLVALQGQVLNLTSQLANTVTNFSTSSATNFQTAFLQLRQTVINVRDLAGNLQNAINQTPVKRGLTRSVVMALLNTTNIGIYTPFLENYGALPTVDLSDSGQLYIDNFRLLFISNANYFYQVDIQIYCALGWMMQTPQAWTTWLDLFEAMGPYNCDPTLFACQCYATAEIVSCARNNTFGQVDLVNAGQLQASLCAAHTLSAPSYSPVITSSSNFTTYLSSVCALGATGGYQVISLRQKQNITAVYSSSVCAMDYNSMMMINQSPSYSNQNFAYALLSLIPQSFDTVLNQVQSNVDAVDGVCPPGLSTTFQPFEIIETQPASCIQGCFMSYQGPMLPIYALTQPVVTTDVTVNVNGVIYDEYDAIVNQQVGYNLQSQYILLGPPGGAGSGNVVYDVTSGNMELSPTASDREGKLTYALTNNPNNFTMAYWVASNGEPFNHMKGSNVASLYKRNLVNVTTSPVCQLNTGQLAGTVCTMLQSLAPSSFQPNNGFAQFEMKTSTYTIDIPVPDGTVYLLQNSGCPGTQILATSSQVVTLVLSNGFSGPIFVDVVLSGACQNQWNNVQVPALGTESLVIPACNAGNQQQSVSVYQVAGASRGAICASGTNLDVTVNRTAILALQGMADLHYVVSQTITAQDAINAQTMATQVAMNTILSQLVMLNVQSSAPLIVADPTILSNYGDILGSLNVLASNISINTNALSGATLPNFTALTAGYTQQMQASVSQLAVINNTYTALLAQAANELATYDAGQILEVQALNRTIATAQAYKAAMFNWIDGVTANFGAIASINIMGSLASTITGVASGAVNLGEEGINAVEGFVKAVAAEVKKDVSAIGGILGSALGEIAQLGSLILTYGAAAVGIFLGIKWYLNRRSKKNPKIDGMTARDLEERTEHIERWLAAFAKLHPELAEAVNASAMAIEVGHLVKSQDGTGAHETPHHTTRPNREGFVPVADGFIF